MCNDGYSYRTRAFEYPLLDSRFGSVKVSVILDLENTAALSLPEPRFLLCRELQTLSEPATSYMDAVRPQESLQLMGEVLNRARYTQEQSGALCASLQSLY